MAEHTWHYRTLDRQTRTITAAAVEFTAHHVVWTDAAGVIVLALHAENVRELSQQPSPPAAAPQSGREPCRA